MSRAPNSSPVERVLEGAAGENEVRDGAVTVERPTLEEFTAAAEAFLAARWPLKQDGGPRPFVWGEGSDEMKVFQEPDPAAEADEQRRRWLPALYRGDIFACQLFSEPDAGSDLAGLKTRAVRDGEVWRLSGQKVWTSGAHLADIGEIICRTADGPRHANLTAFIVDMHAPGVTVRPLRQMTGGASFNEVYLDDVVVPDTDRLDEEGRGWPVALTTLSHERSAMGHSAFGGVGLLRTDRLLALVRHLGCADDPVVRQHLAELIVQLRVARLNQQRMQGRPGIDTITCPSGRLRRLRPRPPHHRRHRRVGHLRLDGAAARRARLPPRRRHRRDHAPHPGRAGARPAPLSETRIMA